MKATIWCLAAVLAAIAPAAAQAERTARDEGAAAADFDGDGKADFAVKFDGGTWRIDFAANGFGAWDWSGTGYGAYTALPVPADYDGDRKADLALKSDTGDWYIDYARDGFGGWNPTYPGFGGPSYHPVPADYDGDGKADLSVKSDTGEWYIDYARDGFGGWNPTYLGFGGPSYHPVPADYDGDGKADISVKSDTGEWYIDYARDGFGGWNPTYIGYGPESSRPLPADYDGDRKADLAVKQDCGRLQLDFAAGGFGPWNASVATASAPDNQRTVTTLAQLKEALTSDFVGSVWVSPGPGGIDLTGERDLPLQSCVWLRGRREKLLRAPLLHTTDDGPGEYSQFVVKGNGVRVEGLWLRGPAAGRRSRDLPHIDAVRVRVDPADHRGFGLVVHNNEANEWPGGAVRVDGPFDVEDSPAEVPLGTPRLSKDTPGLPAISENYLHHNARDGLGYGVEVSNGGYARIEGNVFDFNRHAVASNGRAHTGYLAFHNLVLQGGFMQSGDGFDFYNQHFDVHGRGDDEGYGGAAGEYYEIAYNTIRGEQEYALGVRTRPAFLLRGRTALGSYFHDNVAVHDDLDEAVSLKMSRGATGIGEDHEEFNFHASGNVFDAERWQDMGVGDFDADGRADLLLATGKQWFYSSGGQADWRYLMPASERIWTLRFGEFDGLPGTDVFITSGGRWYFASAGRTWWQPLRADSTPLSDLLFGDFDGNGRTDVLKTDGARWYISRDARGAWEWINTSGYRASGLRVGDFDGDGRDDVFSPVANGNWSVSWGAQTGWDALPYQLSTVLSELVFEDFDGDGRTDMARARDGKWWYTSAGRTAWRELTTPPAVYAATDDAYFGDFTGDGKCDAVRFERRPSGASVDTGTRLFAWRGLGTSNWLDFSWNPMR